MRLPDLLGLFLSVVFLIAGIVAVPLGVLASLALLIVGGRGRAEKVVGVLGLVEIMLAAFFLTRVSGELTRAHLYSVSLTAITMIFVCATAAMENSSTRARTVVRIVGTSALLGIAGAFYCKAFGLPGETWSPLTGRGVSEPLFLQTALSLAWLFGVLCGIGRALLARSRLRTQETEERLDHGRQQGPGAL